MSKQLVHSSTVCIIKKYIPKISRNRKICIYNRTSADSEKAVFLYDRVYRNKGGEYECQNIQIAPTAIVKANTHLAMTIQQLLQLAPYLQQLIVHSKQQASH